MIKKAIKRKQDQACAELSEAVLEKRSKVTRSASKVTDQSCDARTKAAEASDNVTNEQGKTVQRVSVDVQAPFPRSMDPMSGKVLKNCNCKNSASTIIGGNGAGWEGSALINHGSHIKIGCLQFVFSVTNFGHPNPNSSRETFTGHSQGSAGSRSVQKMANLEVTANDLIGVIPKREVSSSQMSISSNSSTLSATSTPSKCSADAQMISDANSRS